MQNIELNIGKGYRKVESGEDIKYFDQYYSFTKNKWRSTTKKLNERMIVSYIPTRRSTNIWSFGVSFIKKIFKQ